MKIAVSDLRPNPFRDMDRYPINEAKVEALVASIKSTSFWDNLVARKSDKDGLYELAYGHHRLTALKKVHQSEINIPVRDLSDETMLKMMAHENMEEWGANAAVMLETIRATVLAYANDKIALPSVPEKTSKNKIRYAPGFGMEAPNGPGPSTDHPYVSENIADFLGWGGDRVRKLLDFLALQERKVAPVSVKGINVSAIDNIVIEANRYSEKPEVAAAVASGLIQQYREGMPSGHASGGHQKARDAASQIAAKHGYRESTAKKRKPPPNQNKAAYNLAKMMETFTPSMMRNCEKIAGFAEHVESAAKKKLIKSIGIHIKKWEKIAERLGA